MIGLIGKKIGMSQVFNEEGKVTPVTVLECGPCRVIQRKSVETDGYDSVQLGFEKIEEKRTSKPLAGHYKKHNSPTYRYVKEFRLKLYKDIQEGEEFNVSMFRPNELIELTGTSKGRGFAGVMKRHGMHGFKASHGVHESYRGGGSIGQCATPSRVHKGKKMPGRMGTDRVSVKNERVIKVDEENNLLFVAGAVPGHRNSIVTLKKEI
ncbi:MAG: 50S ribosomal protein L3 [Candidatus Cloacimonetes bacterium]|nr:50S ribosomal protein L3 [Candidatus Cloacimonadota bacterium]